MREVDRVRAMQWLEGRLRLLDQRELPAALQYLDLETAAATAQAIRDMVVRGAPAIGITAAYGVALAARGLRDDGGWHERLHAEIERLAEARPTAINLRWALARMTRVVDTATPGAEAVDALLTEATRIHSEDVAANRRMGALGAALMDTPAVITHCNTGSLATGGYGTALGVIRSAFAERRIGHVYAGETRPWLQGARLTTWELVQDAIPVSVIADAGAAGLLARGEVGWAVVGADRVAANGDVANKIGTYSLAVNARYHGVKLMVVAPTSTIDMATPSGADIPIETRPNEELLSVHGERVAANGALAWSPVFDITPAALVDALVTERGVVWHPDRGRLEALLGAPAEQSA